MKMKQLLSIGALTLTLVTCTSMSVFAAEAVGSRNEAAKNVAINAWKGQNVINNVSINANTAVNKYATQALIDKVKACVETSIEDKALAKKVNDKIQEMYNSGKGAKEIFEALQDINQTEGDITTDATFDAAKAALQSMLNEFVDANGKSNAELSAMIKTYFNVSPYGTLEYGKNSNNRRVVTLKKGSKIVFQVSSENVYNLKDELENKINSWSDLKDYFGKIQ
ncbi:hypothetical protein HMPREF1084_03360 [Clostridium butyricum 60E.3]|uniref:Uncharacterized protein n=1 Tax=Clostridium butyricum TaxID=1492 RepID=A0A6N3BLL6_CLOBU|nr:hypothetical protein [Clostridium butyricum]ALP91637.1 hypothetical protein ATN24_16235 [Clostridium butyricum]ALS18132.1 hypothetical protein ATD26_14940 [Clostridium butyricum]ANF15257.1 hypothetical protein AZ909_14690 [Clostridium butyricum]AOR95206.1 hypothetical protein BBB49_14250 [Clostridium butyricum]EMU55873.1 hypothetical protein CBDKU1_02150 [Clostridium butyricum DKU-01]